MNIATNTVLKTIWKLQVPCAVQLFLWWACNEILPTKEKLYGRKIVSDPIFPMCGLEPETNGHSLWWSRASIAVWAGSSRRIQKCVTQEGNFLTIFEDLSSRLEIEELELMAMIAQRL